MRLLLKVIVLPNCFPRYRSLVFLKSFDVKPDFSVPVRGNRRAPEYDAYV